MGAGNRSIDPHSRMHLDGAIGWLGLGNFREAALEIEKVSAAFSHYPDVLEVRWEITGKEGEWEAALTLAESLVVGYPDRCSGWLHRSYCLHELGRTLEAWNKLLPAVERFPKEATIPYNLACYACQLGNLEHARVWLEKAAQIRGRRTIKALAADDADLKPLRTTLEEW